MIRSAIRPFDLIRGRVWKFGDNVNTDVIYPGKYLKVVCPEETAEHCFETVYPDFRRSAKKGDIIVAGRYFGCGSSREQAVSCLKYFGIGAIVAESFARIYYRNAVNLGLPIVVCPGITSAVEEGQVIAIDLKRGIIRNETTGDEIAFTPLPDFLLEIFRSGGLLEYTKHRLGLEGR